MSNLAGLHDIEATIIAPPDTWIVDTVALSDNPQPTPYPGSLHHITRLNWAYGSGGTLPLPSVYDAFAQLVAKYVNGSSGCRRWQIGNETNLRREWPDGVPIFPWHYAACYKLCREAIHALPGHQTDEVLIAGSGPWNDECKYEGNPHGDWITYFADTIRLCAGELDGFALHAYTHGYDVNLVTSTARMDAPFYNRYYNFLCYRDYCAAIPQDLRHLPAYITEANGDGPWQAVGLMPAMLGEIDHWNRGGHQPAIHCVTFYRYPRYDHFYIEGRGDVIAEYNGAVALGYQSPATVQPPQPTPGPEPIPPPATDDYLIVWDKRLDVRGTELTVAASAYDESVWRCIAGKWFDQDQAEGRVNVFVTLLDEQDQLAVGVPVRWFWANGDEVKQSEVKRDPWLGHHYSCDFAMYNVAPSYGVVVDDHLLSDALFGMGLGSIQQPDYKIHTCYAFTFKRIRTTDIPPAPPTGDIETGRVTAIAGLNVRSGPDESYTKIGALTHGSTVLYDAEDAGWLHLAEGWVSGDYVGPETFAEIESPPAQFPSGKLIWPVQGARITRRFGEEHDYYNDLYGADGHNGLDFGLAAGSPIYATADGIVQMTGNDAPGYGIFCRLYHPSVRLGSLYAHCSELLVHEGEHVTLGQQIATVGSTGNSSGAHLHWELCAQNVSGYINVTHGHSKGRCNPEVVMWVLGSPPVYG